MTSIIIDDIRLAGIPCQAEISTHKAYRGSRERGGVQLEPDEPAGWDLERVLDRNGYKAPWLERKLAGRVEEDFLIAIDERLALESEPDDYLCDDDGYRRGYR